MADKGRMPKSSMACEFDPLGSQFVMSWVEAAAHDDPAIGGFLGLLAQDMQHGRHIGPLPANLIASMQARLQEPVDLDAEISGAVDL